MPRGQSRNGKGRQTLLDAAIGNFTRLGYHGTSMRDIAGEAKVTVASIYHHFPAKQTILVEIMTSTLRDVIAFTRQAVEAAGADPVDQLEALVRSWILFHTERQAEALIGASELRSLEGEGRAQVVALRDEQESVFRDVIARGVEVGAFATPYPRDASRAIINMGYSVASWYRADGDTTPSAMADRYVELALAIVRAIGAPPPSPRKRASRTKKSAANTSSAVKGTRTPAARR